ncbi:uncharacterized protein LOC126897569 [Daktulosphaira vitifoliae]|uniref:uncharacterized protein LOC126897569 n=1 Tax=Daktulosphaira vitifoliae TaxID=58002 RepID=UPI0021A9B0B1|nr:uncharacterized protein LOC126897569 [Daktulosphaira vitifoliae]
MYLSTVGSLLLLLLATSTLSSESPNNPKLNYKINCDNNVMTIDIKRTEDIKSIYLSKLKFYPIKACKPIFEEDLIKFRLSLEDFYQCGITKVTNKGTGAVTYYHQVVIEKDEGSYKSFLDFKCWFGGKSGNHTMTKRNVLPAGFQEPEDLEITTLTKNAPVPMLKIGVRQDGNIVDGELNVNPQTLLQMEIYLDKESAPIYGLLVSYMKVTDTKAQEETIIFNGCSLDPLLFQNFNTTDGDMLTAKFRAFKFPESTYVQFIGTVNVCLDKCRGVDCSNGKIGFGRKRREISGIPPDPNKVFEVSMTTFIKVEYKNEIDQDKVKLDTGIPYSEEKQANSNSLDIQPKEDIRTNKNNNHMRVDTEEIREELKYTVLGKNTGGSGQDKVTSMNVLTIISVSAILFWTNVFA